MMHIVSIKSLEEINAKTKEIKELKDIYERQNEILKEVFDSPEEQECKEATILTNDEYWYFNINLKDIS